MPIPKLTEREVTQLVTIEQQARELARLRSSMEHTKYWYSTRMERIDQWVREEVRPISEALARRFFSIVANGKADFSDPPTYAQEMNRLTHRAEIAEKQALEHSQEVDRSHAALDEIYENLVVLESTLALEQLLFCPIELCKWGKHPEWEERFEHGNTPEGREQRALQRAARTERLNELRRARRSGR